MIKLQIGIFDQVGFFEKLKLQRKGRKDAEDEVFFDIDTGARIHKSRMYEKKTRQKKRVEELEEKLNKIDAELSAEKKGNPIEKNQETKEFQGTLKEIDIRPLADSNNDPDYSVDSHVTIQKKVASPFIMAEKAKFLNEREVIWTKTVLNEEIKIDGISRKYCMKFPEMIAMLETQRKKIKSKFLENDRMTEAKLEQEDSEMRRYTERNQEEMVQMCINNQQKIRNESNLQWINLHDQLFYTIDLEIRLISVVDATVKAKKLRRLNRIREYYGAACDVMRTLPLDSFDKEDVWLFEEKGNSSETEFHNKKAELEKERDSLEKSFEEKVRVQ